ncbi:TetR/AcrR family transcriptional regulator [Vallitalea pronyensis]|uniref:TetR/AcrR family transcriptional regulator n=1 Tax=Vallitalea pronyensis TaxID=1348613 RepID=A0A8J8MPH2_9FIRM|nr:TetR/AcrR family transcriptional regulator [Vallitalea pronyensis]QUI25219.1 TetR/AcrR family transcriptional regulator [Vallitalea pronyensis]
MNKREAIIMTAARLIHEQGYHHVGIKSILDELSIPKGSFYHYFKSKEELGLAIIELYIKDTSYGMSQSDNTIAGIKQFFNIFFNRLVELELKRGCPFGNLVVELSDENESFRLKLLELYNVMTSWITDILKGEAIEYPDEKAKALFAAFEGTMLASKLEKDPIHFEIFNQYTFPAIIQAK